MAKKSFYLIDGHAQIFRAYFAPFRDLTSPTGEPTKATFVFSQWLVNLIQQRKPDYLAMVIDSGGDVGVLCGVKQFDAATVLFELGCLLSDRVVSCCAAVATHLRKTTLIAGRKSVVIPNGIPVEIFGRAGERRRDGEFVFGTVGRLVPVKDHRSLIQAFARVAREKQCRLEVLGDGPLRNELEEAARAAGVADSVRFLGAGLDVGAFLSGIDAFVLSSLSEGLPLTVLEAMASGLPVLSTEVGAVPELVNSARCGWIVPPGDADALAAAMLEAATAGDLEERGGRARDYVRGEYSTTVMASGYESLFTSLLTAH
jgi:glycosyltransferase involved in cell wall biosynthesis